MLCYGQHFFSSIGSGESLGLNGLDDAVGHVSCVLLETEFAIHAQSERVRSRIHGYACKARESTERVAEVARTPGQKSDEKFLLAYPTFVQSVNTLRRR